jgi:ribosome biogenesis protein Tsr3
MDKKECDWQREHYESQVKKLAERARRTLVGSNMYGIPIDLENLEEVLAALVLLHDLVEMDVPHAKLAINGGTQKG